MKKTPVVFIVVLLAFHSYSFGQFRFGYKLGLNICNVRNSTNDNYTSKPGFNTGLVTEYNLNEKYFLNTGLLISAKGFQSLLIPAGTTATNLYYLSLPVLQGVNFSRKFSFVLGPEVNYLLSALMKNSSKNTSVIDDFNKWDISLDAGLIFNITRHIFIDCRYSYGLSQIREHSEISGWQYNRVIQGNLTFLF